MNYINVCISRSRGTTIIDGDNFFVTFDSRSGAMNKPVICILGFCARLQFFEELALFDFVRFDVTDYYIKNDDFTILTLKPMDGYTNEKMEKLFCHIVRLYENLGIVPC